MTRCKAQHGCRKPRRPVDHSLRSCPELDPAIGAQKTTRTASVTLGIPGAVLSSPSNSVASAFLRPGVGVQKLRPVFQFVANELPRSYRSLALARRCDLRQYSLV